MNYKIVRTDELYHGVKGMKWGVHKAVTVAGRLRNSPRVSSPYDRYGRPTSDMSGNRVTYDRNGRMKKVDPVMDTLRNTDRVHRKTSESVKKVAVAGMRTASYIKDKKSGKSESKTVSKKTQKKAAKDYKKAYNSKEIELYRRNSDSLEKLLGDAYFRKIDSIESEASKHARNYIKKKYNLSIDDINRGKKRIPSRMIKS